MIRRIDMHSPLALAPARIGPGRGPHAARGLPLLLAAALALGLSLAACQKEKEDQGSQGTISAPIPIGTAPGVTFPDATVGKAPSSSYYSVITAAGLSSHTVTLTSLTDDADLIVFSDAGFTVLYCNSTTAGTATESCGPPAPADTTALYIQVKSFSATGLTFSITVN